MLAGVWREVANFVFMNADWEEGNGDIVVEEGSVRFSAVSTLSVAALKSKGARGKIPGPNCGVIVGAVGKWT